MAVFRTLVIIGTLFFLGACGSTLGHRGNYPITPRPTPNIQQLQAMQNPAEVVRLVCELDIQAHYAETEPLLSERLRTGIIKDAGSIERNSKLIEHDVGRLYDFKIIATRIITPAAAEVDVDYMDYPGGLPELKTVKLIKTEQGWLWDTIKSRTVPTTPYWMKDPTPTP